MAEENFELKNPFNARLSPEENEMAVELIREMNPEFNHLTTGREILNFLVNRAHSKTKLNSVSKPEDLNKIQALENEIARQKILIDQKDEASESLSQQLLEVNEKIDTLDQSAKKKILLPENSIVLALTERQKSLIEVVAQRLSARYKQTLDPGKILFHLFWKHYVKQESEPPFMYVLNNSDLKGKKPTENG